MSEEFDKLVASTAKMLETIPAGHRQQALDHMRGLIEHAAAREGRPDFAKEFADRVIAAVGREMDVGSAVIISPPQFRH